MDAVLSCMVTDSLGPGSLSDQLITSVAAYLGLPGGIALRERTRSFGIALDELGLEPGTAVLLDPLVPHAYHAELVARGLHPVYVDVLPGSVCMDPARAAEAVADDSEGARTVGAIVVQSHLGYVPDLEALAALGVPMIEDISESIGANTGDARVGTFGRFTLLALEPDGVITAGGGTLLLANSRTDRSSLARLADALPPDTLLPDMNAALGTIQIKEIEKYIARRAEIAGVFSRALMRGRHRGLVQDGEAQNVHFGYPVVVEGSVSDVAAYARKRGVETHLAFAGSALDAYGSPERDLEDEADQNTGDASADLLAESDYPNARSLLLRCVLFPLYPSLTSREVASVERVLASLP
jgi:dTDP-4-amino-4,6-dideoxygalactose transaminase